MSTPTHPTYSPAAAANVFLALASAEHRPLTNLKIQKLLYFANGLYLAATGSRLISEPFQAWTYGPVLLSLYSHLRVFRDTPISVPSLDAPDAIPADSVAYSIILVAWERLRAYSAWQLVQLTHKPGTPWHRAYAERGRFAPIADSDLRAYFTR